MDTIKSLLHALWKVIVYLSRTSYTTFLWWIGKIKNASSRKVGCAWLIGGFTVLTMLCSLGYAATPGGRQAVADSNATSTAVVLARATSDMATQNAPTHTPTTTSTATHTAVPPTATLIPPTQTSTPVPPTSTNTRTPIPSATPLPTIEPTEQAYIGQIGNIANTYADALDGLGQQLTDAGENPALIFDQEWIIDTAAIITTIRLNNEEVRTLEPPEQYQPGQALMLEVANHLDVAMDAYIEGIDNLDVDKITQGNEALLLGNQAITNAAQTFAAIRAGTYHSPEATAVPVTTAVSTPLPTLAATAEPPSDATSGGSPFQCDGGCATPPDPSCAIKGNVNSSGERIYHVPGGAFYDRTDIKPEEGDRWFCTEAEAQAAGFRRSQR